VTIAKMNGAAVDDITRLEYAGLGGSVRIEYLRFDVLAEIFPVGIGPKCFRKVADTPGQDI